MSHSHRPRTVLIVDDESSLLDLLDVALRGEGYEVTTAPDGNAALDALAARRFDFIVSDYMMPGLDGLRLLEALRARGDTTFFLLMTSMPLDRVRAQPPACNAYLQKPFTIGALLAQLI